MVFIIASYSKKTKRTLSFI